MPLKPYKIGECITCGKQDVQVVADRCIGSPYCYEKHRIEVRAARNAERGIAPQTKPNKPINKISDKQAKLNAAYNILNAQFKKDNKYCKAALPDCQYLTTETHHKKGRGPYLLDQSTWLPVCSSCHHWIEEHPDKAKFLGLSEDRL